MTLLQFEYVIAVDKHRHFKKAAESCFVTQPTLSMQIQKLEEEIGFGIFDRTKSPVVPTEKGLEFIQSCKNVLYEVTKMKSHLDEITDEVKGEFHLGIIPTLAPYLLPLFLKQFHQKYPEVKLTVSELKTSEILESLASDKIDAGLLITPLPVDRYYTRPLFFEPFYYFVNPGSPLIKKSSVNESDVKPEDLWMLQEGHCFRDQVLNYCHLKDKTLSGKKMIFESENLETLKNLVSQGSGNTFLPHLATLNLNKKQRDQLKEFKGSTPTREVSLIFSRQVAKKNIINAIEDSILHSLPKEIPVQKTKKLKVVKI